MLFWAVVAPHYLRTPQKDQPRPVSTTTPIKFIHFRRHFCVLRRRVQEVHFPNTRQNPFAEIELPSRSFALRPSHGPPQTNAHLKQKRSFRDRWKLPQKMSHNVPIDSSSLFVPIWRKAKQHLTRFDCQLLGDWRNWIQSTWENCCLNRDRFCDALNERKETTNTWCWNWQKLMWEKVWVTSVQPEPEQFRLWKVIGLVWWLFFVMFPFVLFHLHCNGAEEIFCIFFHENPRVSKPQEPDCNTTSSWRRSRQLWLNNRILFIIYWNIFTRFLQEKTSCSQHCQPLMVIWAFNNRSEFWTQTRKIKAMKQPVDTVALVWELTRFPFSSLSLPLSHLFLSISICFHDVGTSSVLTRPGKLYELTNNVTSSSFVCDVHKLHQGEVDPQMCCSYAKVPFSNASLQQRLVCLRRLLHFPPYFLYPWTSLDGEDLGPVTTVSGGFWLWQHLISSEKNAWVLLRLNIRRETRLCCANRGSAWGENQKVRGWYSKIETKTLRWQLPWGQCFFFERKKSCNKAKNLDGCKRKAEALSTHDTELGLLCYILEKKPST